MASGSRTRRRSPGVQLVLTSGEWSRRDVTADGSGDFVFDELNPADYKLALDPATIPPNFIGPKYRPRTTYRGELRCGRGLSPTGTPFDFGSDPPEDDTQASASAGGRS